MKTYPTGDLAKSLIEYHIGRIQTMERELALIREENEILHSIIKQQNVTHETKTQLVRQD